MLAKMGDNCTVSFRCAVQKTIPNVSLGRQFNCRKRGQRFTGVMLKQQSAALNCSANGSLERREKMQTNKVSHPMVAINIGAEIFADALEQQGIQVARVAWRPPAGDIQALAK